MKIINRQEFLKLPPNTLFNLYKPCIFSSLEIKMESLQSDDFLVQDINCPVETTGTEDWHKRLDEAEKFGRHLPMDFDSTDRDVVSSKISSLQSGTKKILNN